MAAPNTEEIFIRYRRLRNDRSVWESHWEEIAERVLPRSRIFTGEQTPGDKRTSKLYDATAALACERFASAVESLLTPRGARWHQLRATDPNLNRDNEVRLWFEQVTELMFAYRYSPKSFFSSQMHEGYMSIGAFGTAGMFVDEHPEGGLMYRHIHLSDLYVAENEMGQIDTVFRRFKVTARQAMRMFADGDLSDNIRKLASDRPDDEIELLHVCCPRTDRDTNARDRKNRKFFSGYYDVAEEHLIEEGGMDEMGYILSRYNTGPREIYGRSPAMTILPEIKMINEMSKTVIRAGQKAVDPPLIIADDGVILPVNAKPGAATFARMDGRSQPPIQPLFTGARVDIGMDMMEQRRRMINDSFLVTLFQILVESPQMTATEVLQRAQEKGALLAPTVGRQQSETLGPLIEREFSVLAEQGLIPPLPPLLEETGGEYQIEYVSPLTQAMRAPEGVGILRTLESVQAIAAIDPTVMDNFDADQITRTLAEINGAPASIMRDENVVAEMRGQRQQAEAVQQSLNAAPQLADAGLKVAQIADMGQQ